MSTDQNFKIAQKCVLVIDNTQPAGIMANISSVLSLTLGRNINDIVSHDVYDKQKEKHPGITQLPIPILGASKDKIKKIRRHLLTQHCDDLFLVDFSTTAQHSKTYEEYETTMQNLTEKNIDYVGIGIYGDKKTVNKATGNLRLIR